MLCFSCTSDQVEHAKTGCKLQFGHFVWAETRASFLPRSIQRQFVLNNVHQSAIAQCNCTSHPHSALFHTQEFPS